MVEEIISSNFNASICKTIPLQIGKNLDLLDSKAQNKIGELTDAIEIFVIEERNGIFELELDYPVGYPFADKLEKENIIVANANDTLRNQKFRIYDVKKFMDNTITVFARHISFDLIYDVVNNVTFTNQSCEYALNQLFRQSQFSTHYRGYSDIINAQDYSMSMCNILEAIGGKEGSVIDTFGTGAEILRDNENIHVLNRRGHDNDVSIEYAKNLIGFELEEDTTDLATRIIGYAKYTVEGTSEQKTIKTGNVDSPLINNYSHPYIMHKDYSDKFQNGEIPTVSKIETLIRNEYRDNKIDIPKINYKIEFIPLSKCVGYEGLEDKIGLCDTVTIKNSRYNVDTKAKVIKYKFDVLKDRYESMEIGEPKTTLGDVIGGGSGEDGKPGPPGPPGPPGEDGNIGDFPNSLPPKSVLTGKSVGLATIDLSWTFENKAYYSYELYASKTPNFIPNSFDLIFEGQASSYLYQVKPNETWYFRVCAINSYGNRNEFSDQINVTTSQIDVDTWIPKGAIGEAYIGTLSLDRGWVGQLNANLLDVKGNFSVTDGNGNRTLDIDSFGTVSLAPSVVNIAFNGIGKNIQILPSEFRINTENGKGLTLKNGRLNIYDESDGTVTGYVGQTYTSDDKNYRYKGNVFASGFHSYFTEFGNDAEWKEDNQQTGQNFKSFLQFVCSEFLGRKVGVHANQYLFANEGASIKNMELDGNITCKYNNTSYMGDMNNALYRVYANSIRTNLENFKIYTKNNNYGGFVFGDGYFYPEYNNGFDIGVDNKRVNTIFLTNAPNVTSDANSKANINYITKSMNKSIQDITIDDMYSFIKDDLKIAEFNYKDSKSIEKDLGFIAQDLIDNKVGNRIVKKNSDGSLAYDMGNRITVLEGALQKAIEKIEILEKEIATLKGAGA